MIAAVQESITTRRATLAAGIVGIVAGVVAPARSPAIVVEYGPPPDAHLVLLCDQVAALENEFTALFARRNSLAAEAATAGQLAMLQCEKDALMSEIETCGLPSTPDGIAAVARLGLLLSRRAPDGTPIAYDDAEMLLQMAAQGLIQNT